MYRNLSVKAILELAAPHTWPASVLPVFLAAVLALRFDSVFSPACLFPSSSRRCCSSAP
jgi:1,4-dihydroxy-2-naphthoate octaprenyltransferase